MTKVLFVHGAWVGPRCWDSWRNRCQERGLETLAPAWPYDDRQYDELRELPDPRLAQLGVREIADHYERIIRALPEPPILVGHSFGGLIVQILVSRGLGSAGVAVNSGPPRGVLPTPRALWAALPVLLTWRGWTKILRLTLAQFIAGFVHRLPPHEQRAAYEHHVLPTPGRIYFQAAFAPFHGATAVDFRRSDRAPLLLIAGDDDHTAPRAMVRANHRAYRKSRATTELLEFDGRSHWIIAEPGWQEVCDVALDWATKHANG